MPMSPLAASATVVNLILATGPFTYPYAYTSLGPVISAPLLFTVAILAYVSATYLVETLSIATAIKGVTEVDLGVTEIDGAVTDAGRKESLFEVRDFKTPELEEKLRGPDAHIKNSEFYIREKMELGILAERVSYPWFKYFIIIMLTIYVYGACSLKYVTGAISLVEGLSLIFTGYEGLWLDEYPWTYYPAIAVFAALSIGFSFGDIENSKVLQIVTSFIRVFVVILMYGGTIYYWVDDGTHKAKTIEWSEQLQSLSTVFGNTVFIFIYHHSIPGIIYPVRP